MSFDLITLLIVSLAILIVGISKGGLGGGLGVMGVPLMSLTMAPAQAAAILLPILCFMDLMTVRAFWKQWSKQQLLSIIPAALLGILIGTLTFHYFRSSDIRLLVGLIAIGFALNYWLKPAQKLKSKPPGRVAAWFWSSIAGFTSFIAHAGGPPINLYLLPQKLPKSVYQGTTALFFMAVNYVKLVPYALLGQFGSSNLQASLIFAPVALIGVWAGYRLHHHMPEKLFFQIAYVLLFITGCKLLFDGIAGL